MIKKRTEIVPIKKKRTEIAPLKKKKISKLDLSEMTTIVGDSAEEIQQLLEINQGDSASNLIQKRVLQSLVDILPLAEDAVRKSNGTRNIYAFNSLITSIREMMIDMQSVKDRGALGDSLVDKIIRPAFTDIGMSLVQEEQRLVTAIASNVDKETAAILQQHVNLAINRLGHMMKEKYGEAKSSTIKFLQG